MAVERYVIMPIDTQHSSFCGAVNGCCVAAIVLRMRRVQRVCGEWGVVDHRSDSTQKPHSNFWFCRWVLDHHAQLSPPPTRSFGLNSSSHRSRKQFGHEKSRSSSQSNSRDQNQTTDQRQRHTILYANYRWNHMQDSDQGVAQQKKRRCAR